MTVHHNAQLGRAITDLRKLIDGNSPYAVQLKANADQRALVLAMKDLPACDIGRIAVRYMVLRGGKRAAQAMIGAATDELVKVMK